MGSGGVEEWGTIPENRMKDEVDWYLMTKVALVQDHFSLLR